MSRKVLESQLVDARSQLAEAQRELELSTFLNKGVLQTNSEFKLRIAELEQENAVLRIAESRLARTEDRADLAEKRAKEILAELKEKESQWAGSVRAEAEVREEMEAELETLREDVRSWAEIGERVGGMVARSKARGDKGVRRTVNAVAGPSKPSQSSRTTPVIPSATKSTAKTEPSSSRHRATSPSTLVQSARIQKRRRRIEDSGDKFEGDAADAYQPSSPRPERTPTRPARTTATRATRANSSSTKTREAPPSKRNVADSRKRTPLAPVQAVKVESQSPERESEEESEDDPLYLE